MRAPATVPLQRHAQSMDAISPITKNATSDTLHATPYSRDVVWAAWSGQVWQTVKEIRMPVLIIFFNECRADERASLLSRGLADRKAPVRECTQQLLCQWLEADAGGSIPALLQLLDARLHEDACLQVVRTPEACMTWHGHAHVAFHSASRSRQRGSRAMHADRLVHV